MRIRGILFLGKGARMKNIMVCVTKQKNCQRLIDFGKSMIKSDDQLYIIHVAHSDFNFLGKSKENEALEYLFNAAMEAGASLTVEKSDNVLDKLIELVNENNIDEVVVGQSGENPGPVNFLTKLRNKLNENVQLVEVSA